MSLEIRKLTRADAPAYSALRLEAVEGEPLSFGQTPEEHRLIPPDETDALIEHEHGFLVGGFDGEKLVAFARFLREPATKERHKGHLHRVYVTPSYRGRGVARDLITALIDQVRGDATLEQLLLSVGTFNHGARRVYTSLGFVSWGIEPRSMKVGTEYVDEEHMVLYLRSFEGRAVESVV